MKRFAAHYLLLPDVGFIRQQVVEIADEGYVRDVFPLTEEIESVEWMPGLIALLPENKIKNTCLLYTSPSPRDLSTSRMPSSA